MRAYTHRFISFAIQCLVILLLAFGLSFSAGQSLAQDVATDTPAPSDTATLVPTDVPTEVPTEAPTAAPTDVITEEPGSEATEAVTEQPSAAPTDATVTDVPTESATQPPATSVSPDLFQDDFQDGETSAWLLTSGWVISDEAGNKVLTASTPNEIATLTGIAWPYFTLSFRVRGAVQLNMASGGSGYQINIASDGAVALYKDGALLGQAAGVPPTDATVEPAANWHTVNLLAPGNILAVKVDNFTPVSTTDSNLVGMGPIMFSTAADNAASVTIDDLSVHRLDVPPPVPTAVPTSGVVPLPPPSDVTAEPTVESTAEATVEATSEATAEATAEATSEATAEATSEATAEATVEATSEATAEATAEPIGLSDEALQKLPPQLIDILQSYILGDTAGTKAAAADYYITTDQQERIDVTVWVKDEQAAARIAGDITATNGLVTDVLSVRLQASVTLEGLLALANTPEVSLIEVPPRAVSTSNAEVDIPSGFGYGTGTQISEGVDTTGAAAWQNAGIKGAGVGIAVMDTGFGPPPVPVASGEYACLFNNTVNNIGAALGDTNHGLHMVQILCDMAPASKVYMYKANTATNLRAAITGAANNPAIKIIVIAMDLGASVSPGDGTGGGIENDLYSAITTARSNGKIVIASAGNNTGSYVTMDYDGVSASLGMTLFAGDIVHVSWNDWSVGGTKRAPSTFTGTYAASLGSTRGGAPRYFYTVPAGICLSGCSETLTFSGGDAGVVQVQVAGKGTIDDTSGATINSDAGNIARPADSPDVIAVGAVCPDGTAFGLYIDTFSSHGPVFSEGGGVPAPLASYTRDQVKPDLSGPTHVSTSISKTTDQGGCDNSNGFNGTSAAAAHVAGMAALLVSNTNPNMSVFDSISTDGSAGPAVDAIQDYLQTHTLDNTALPGYAVGYDMTYGAGYSVLGNPNYNLNLITTQTNEANQLPASCSSALYVGFNNPGGSQDGSLVAPYISINEAMTKATASQCVVLLPGEYVSPIFATSPAVPPDTAVNPTVAPAVMSYDSVISSITAPSNLWSVVLPPIIILSNNGIVVDGFTAQSAFTITYPDGTTIRPPAIRIARGSTGTVIQNTTFTGYKSPGIIFESTNIQIKNNTFTGFAIPVDKAGSFPKPSSSSAALEITKSPNVLLTNNTFQSNSISNIASSGHDITPWEPAIIGISYSGVDIFNNRFVQNTAASILGVNQWLDPTSPDNTSGLNALQSEIRVFGNVFSGNTVNGPLLHLLQAPKLRFINNTVVNNLMSGDPNDSRYDAYFVYGNNDELHNAFYVLNQLSNRRVEIHNNLFYGNSALGQGLLANAKQGVNIGCDSIVGNDTVPVRNNWFDPPIGAAFAGGECGGENATTHIPNISFSIPDSVTAAMFFGSSSDPVDPFRLRPNIDPSKVGGINTGDNIAITDMGFNINTLKDLLGADRVIVGRNENLAYKNIVEVDIGAYELGVAEPPTANNQNIIIEEDSPPIVFQLTAGGGYSRTFAITAPPTNYDTRSTNTCGGQPVAFSPPDMVTYCPPRNFHTFYGTSGANVPVTIDFSVEDKAGNPGLLDFGRISITINPTNDGPPTPVNFSKTTDYGSPLVYQLGPAPTFNNFKLVGSANGRDYPVTFAYVGQDTTSDPSLVQNPNLLDTPTKTTDEVLTEAFAAANDIDKNGLLIVNPNGDEIGRYKFTYRITDRDNESATGTGIITVVPAIAQEGHYDDDSFYITYSKGTGATNGWAPSYAVPLVYNHTLHTTRIVGNQLEFPFTGTIASLNMIGSPTPSALTNKLKVEFNVDAALTSPTWITYAQAQQPTAQGGFGTGFSCVNTLNNQPPDATSSTILNYSAASAAYKLVCRGFPAGAVQSIRLTSTLTNAAMTIDSMDVGLGILSPGFYQQNDINIAYSGTWTTQALAAANGGSRVSSTGTGPTTNYTFQVKNASRFVLYTSSGPTAGTMHVCITPAGGSETCSDRVLTRAGLVMQQQQQVFDGLDAALTYTVQVTNVSPPPVPPAVAKYIDLDAVEVFAPTSALTPGLYQQDNINITYTGSGWIKQAVAAANGGSRTYAPGSTNSYSFQITGASRFTLYTSPNPQGGTMKVCIIAGAIQNCYNRSNYSSVALWQQKQAFVGLDTNTFYTVNVTNISTVATQNIDLDAIDVFGALAPLPVGLNQQEDLNIEYSGTGWKLASTTLASGKSSRYTVGIGDSYKFQIFNAGRFAIYTSAQPTGGTMQVCIAPIPTNATESCTTRNIKNAVAIYQQPQVFTGLDPSTLYTVTVTNIVSTPATPAAVFMDVDAIEVLPPIAPLVPSATLYQQSDPNIIYTGFGWRTLASTAASGSNYRSSVVKDNSYTFQVANAERFVLFVSPGPMGGTMSVSCVELVDGIPTGPSDCLPATAIETAPAAQWQQPRYFTGLNSNKVYLVTVSNTSTLINRFISLDAIQVDGPFVPLEPSPILYEQNNVNIRYAGTGWKTVVNPLASGGDFKYTLTNGDSYTFQVKNATRVALYISPRPGAGIMSVCLTDMTTSTPVLPCTSVNQLSTVVFWRQPQIIEGLNPAKTYSITVTNTAAKFIDLDAIEVLGAIAPLEPGFYQQTNTNITYTGAGWKTVASTLASGGDFKNTLGMGDKYEFKVIGAERFILFTSSGPTGGTMQVCIVPTPTGGTACPDPVNNYSLTTPAALYQQPRYFEGLLPGQLYTVTVTNTSPVATKFISLDAIQVDAPLDPLTPSVNLYQQTDVKIRYTGAGWKTVANVNASLANYKNTTVVGNKYEFKVVGADRFILYTSPGPAGGTMNVCITPTPPVGYTAPCSDVTNNRSDYATAAQFQQPHYFGGLLPGTPYTVTVTNASPPPPAAAKFIDLDAIEVLAPADALTPSTTLYQENDQNITYSGTGWKRGTSTLASLSNFRTTMGMGNSYSFKVSEADRFALFVSTGPTGGIMQVCIVPTPTGGTACPDPVNNYSLTPAALYQQPRYFEGLDSGTDYTVTVTNISTVATKFISLDAIQVDAPIAPLSVDTLHEENDPNIRYTGLGWKNVVNANASGQNYRSTVIMNSSYTFQFTGADRFILYNSPNTTGGTMQVCITDIAVGTPTCSSRSDYGAIQWQQPRFFNGLLPASTYSVTVKNISPTALKYIDLDAIRVLAPAQPLTPSTNLYQQDNTNITYIGTGWSKSLAATASDNSYYVNKLKNDSYTFQITGATRFSLLTSPGPTGGTMGVTCMKVGGLPTDPSACTPATAANTAPAARWQQAKIFSGLDAAETYVVTVTNLSTLATQYIDLDAIQIDNAAITDTLQPGWYQDTDLSLSYTGTWAQDILAAVPGGLTTSTKTIGDTMTFRFQGTGFSVFTYNPTTGAAMEVCYKLSTDGSFPTPPSPQCATIPTNVAPATAAQLNVGYALYGLKDGIYDVRIKHVGTGANGTQGLYIDKVAILGSLPIGSVLPAGTYENTDARIVFSPPPLWVSQANINHSGGTTAATRTVTASTSMGATVQVDFVGTTLIVYQAVGPANSKNVLLCRVIEGPNKNPTPQCGSFSQNTPGVAYKVPIAFYGFGSGTNHVVMENRAQGGSLNIDKILVN